MTDLLVLSIPTNATPGSAQLGAPEARLRSWLEENVGAKYGVASIVLPDLKIGTLDGLVQHCEEVGKLDSQLQSIVSKVQETIVSLWDATDKERIKKSESVDGLPAWQYLQQFGWNTAKYRPDRSIAKLLDAIGQEVLSADADLRDRMAAYNAARTAVGQLDRKRSGDLTVRSLESVVRASDVVQDSEYLESVLIVVPNGQTTEFTNTYETVSPMVVPRSAKKITGDALHTLYSVTVFRKFVPEFVAKARELKWIPRELEYEVGNAELQTENETKATEVRTNERRLRSEVERLAAATFADLIKAWGHVKVIRVFVESVLRYGLPPSYVTACFVPERSYDKAEAVLLKQFGYLGGNAVARDARGNLQLDSDLGEFSALGESDYKPFVIYVTHLP